MASKKQNSRDRSSVLLAFTSRSEESVSAVSVQRIDIEESLETLHNHSATFVVMLGNPLDGEDWLHALHPHLCRFDLAFMFTDAASVTELGTGFASIVDSLGAPSQIILTILDYSADNSEGHGHVQKVDSYCRNHSIPIAATGCHAADLPITAQRSPLYERREINSEESPVALYFGALMSHYFLQVRLRRCDDLIKRKLYDLAVVNSVMVLEIAIRELAHKLGASRDVSSANSIWTTVDFLSHLEKTRKIGLSISREGMDRVVERGNWVRHRSYTPTAEEANDAYDFVLRFVYSNVRPDLRGAGIVPT